MVPFEGLEQANEASVMVDSGTTPTSKEEMETCFQFWQWKFTLKHILWLNTLIPNREKGFAKQYYIIWEYMDEIKKTYTLTN